jgi:hypothetical protein
MKYSKSNINFNYLYRDSSNFKQFGSVIFTNPNNLSIEEVNSILLIRLIDEEYFDHTKFGVPSLFFKDRNVDDHNWHEYKNIEITDENPTDKRTIEVFLKQ